MELDKEGVITIDTKALTLIKKEGNVLLTKDAEVQLERLLAAEKFVQDIKEYVCNVLRVAMEKQHVIKIQSGTIVVTKKTYGRRYKAENLEAVAPQFQTNISYAALNTQAVDEYVEQTGQLPENIERAERDERVSIVERKNG